MKIYLRFDIKLVLAHEPRGVLSNLRQRLLVGQWRDWLSNFKAAGNIYRKGGTDWIRSEIFAARSEINIACQFILSLDNCILCHLLLASSFYVLMTEMLFELLTLMRLDFLYRSRTKFPFCWNIENIRNNIYTSNREESMREINLYILELHLCVI